MEKNLLKDYKIGILAGGSSHERAVSLKSGTAVKLALERIGLNVIFLDVKEETFCALIDENNIDVAFIALHGKFGEDGTVQRILEAKNILYTGSGPDASGLAMDKLRSKKVFETSAISIPGYQALSKDQDINSVDIGYPCVVKPVNEGSSIGLSIVLSESVMADAIDKARVFGGEVIIEKFIEGRELTIGVLDNVPLPVVEIITACGIYDFKAKYESCSTRYVVPADLNEISCKYLQGIGLKAHRALGCRGFSRVDVRMDADGQAYVLEVNTIPGLTERSLFPMAAKAGGFDFSRLCIKMLYEAVSRAE
ncbi:MAG: D-alanine--D-alanine ligase [Candidatus Omnitrophota bacterium]